MPVPVDLFEDGFQGLEVGVYVRDDGDFHDLHGSR
jgi:hypothetical protein